MNIKHTRLTINDYHKDTGPGSHSSPTSPHNWAVNSSSSSIWTIIIENFYLCFHRQSHETRRWCYWSRETQLSSRCEEIKNLIKHSSSLDTQEFVLLLSFVNIVKIHSIYISFHMFQLRWASYEACIKN